MVSRPAWNGHLKLSLVTCPVALYKAIEPAKRGVSFNLINPDTGSRVRMKPQDAATGEAVSRADLVKGHAVDGDKQLYVTLTDEELRGIRIASNGAINIERFVAQSDIDRLYWDTPYFLVPDGELAQEPFAVIREAMREAGQVALARVVMNGRERQLALEVQGKGVIAHKIRTQAEVRSAAEHFDRLPDLQPDSNMVDIAKQILRQHEGAFDPTEFVDQYQEAVKALLAEKQKTHGVSRAHRGSTDEAEIVDLMAALKASLGPAQPPARRRAAPAAKARAPAPPEAPAPQRRKRNEAGASRGR